MNERALVLGGGGSAGNAWLIGVVAGLSDAGLDVTDADLVIGTSAGATAAAQLTGAGADRQLAGILAAVPPRRPAPEGSEGGRARSAPAVDHLARTGRIIAAASDATDMRRRMGAAALELEAATDGTWSATWRAAVGARLPSPLWPGREVLIPAVDARTGEPFVFDRHGGVDLVDAVAASTSSAFPYAIGDDRYIDGGYRRNENADLAAGFARVLVLSPLGGRTRHPVEWGMQLAAQVDELRAGGSTVETVLPDGPSLEAFGTNLMDPSTRPPAARAGHAQGRALAGRLTELWR
jgi:NTE family protein